MPDIRFETDNFIFSYRIAGILVQDDKVLLQKSSDDSGFAFPGGHVDLGENTEETLIREFKEELSVDIKVKDLQWIAETFFTHENKKFHQISFYYSIELKDKSQLPQEAMFYGEEALRNENSDIEFHWVNSKEIQNIDLYPQKASHLLSELHTGIKHFIDES